MKLQKFKSNQLSSAEMAKIKGGAFFLCSCNGHAGTWYGEYGSVPDMVNAINEYCREGGTCDSVPAMPI